MMRKYGIKLNLDNISSMTTQQLDVFVTRMRQNTDTDERNAPTVETSANNFSPGTKSKKINKNN